MSRPLYLEQRIALVRRALNEQSLAFASKLPESDRTAFNQWALDLMTILDGDGWGGDARARLGLETPS